MIAPAARLEHAASRSAGDISRSLLALTRPRIVELLLVTAIPAMLVAQRGLPPIRVVVVTLTAVALAAGSANAITCYLGGRPAAGGGAPPVIRQAEALAFGVALGAAATLLLGTLANWLSAALADAATAVFVIVSARRLKRGSRSDIVIGAAVGCFPVLVAWSAVTGTLSFLPVVLSAVILCWVPPRLWALAMEFRGDTGAGQAATPAMTGSVAADAGAGRILCYSCVMLAATLGLAPYGGWIYTACAIALGAWFLAEAHRLRSRVDRVPGSPVTARGAGAAAVPIGLRRTCLAQLLAVVMAGAVLPPVR